MNTSLETLYQGFLESMETGDEANVMAYLEAHINEFPEDLKQKIIFAAFEDSVNQQHDDLIAVEEFKAEGLDLLTRMGKVKQQVEEAYKIAQLKDELAA